MPKFTVGQRVRVAPTTVDPAAYPQRNRHGYVRQVHERMVPTGTGDLLPSAVYEVLLDGDLVRGPETVMLPEHTLEIGPR